MKLLILFTVSLFTSISFSQSKREWGFEYRQKIGFLAAHRGVMGHLPQDQAIAGEFSYYIHTKGRKQWHQPCNYPTVGATFFAGSVGNNEILGKFMGLYGFIEFPFINQKQFEFSGKLAAGLGHGSKVFDQETNPKNVAMSTHFNAQICLGLKTTYKFHRNKLTLGLDLTQPFRPVAGGRPAPAARRRPHRPHLGRGQRRYRQDQGADRPRGAPATGPHAPTPAPLPAINQG